MRLLTFYVRGRDPGYVSKLESAMLDCAASLECLNAGKHWIGSADPLVQDFGARLLAVLRLDHRGIQQGRTEYAPPAG